MAAPLSSYFFNNFHYALYQGFSNFQIINIYNFILLEMLIYVLYKPQYLHLKHKNFQHYSHIDASFKIYGNAAAFNIFLGLESL